MVQVNDAFKVFHGRFNHFLSFVGGSQMVFMGNPNDYAWGREGLDTIVTQLLNQMDNSGNKRK